MDESLKDVEGYCQFEYIKNELRNLFALADIVISRAGANAICELLALHKPNLLIPLSANASRGDQILNARSFERQGFSLVLEEEQLTKETLLNAVKTLYENRTTFINSMKNSGQQDSIGTIISLIEEVLSFYPCSNPPGSLKVFLSVFPVHFFIFGFIIFLYPVLCSM